MRTYIARVYTHWNATKRYGREYGEGYALPQADVVGVILDKLLPVHDRLRNAVFDIRKTARTSPGSVTFVHARQRLEDAWTHEVPVPGGM